MLSTFVMKTCHNSMPCQYVSWWHVMYLSDAMMACYIMILWLIFDVILYWNVVLPNHYMQWWHVTIPCFHVITKAYWVHIWYRGSIRGRYCQWYPNIACVTKEYWGQYRPGTISSRVLTPILCRGNIAHGIDPWYYQRYKYWPLILPAMPVLGQYCLITSLISYMSPISFRMFGMWEYHALGAGTSCAAVCTAST